MKEFIPRVIFIEPDADKYEYAQKILNKFPDVERRYVEEYNEKEIDLFNSIEHPITIGKEILLLRKYKGSFLKKCPGSKGLLCCNYYVINVAMNCHFDCTYCSLQNYLNTQAMTLFTNLDDILNEVDAKINAYQGRVFRMGTGELADSLALDDITELSKVLVPFFADKSNALLELKTKSDMIVNLQDLNHNGRTVISFSMNPQSRIDSDEFGTASLKERLVAAKTVESWGYKLAFHFDPLVYSETFEEDYAEVIKLIFEYVNKDNIEWISLGGFRFSKEIAGAVKERFPKSDMILGEFWLSDDNKMRYYKKTRKKMYSFVRSEIMKYHKKAPIYMCMESKDMWVDVFGYMPHVEENAEKLFDFRH